MGLVFAILRSLWHHGFWGGLRIALATGIGLAIGVALLLALYRLCDRRGFLPSEPPLGPWLRAAVVVTWAALLPFGCALGGALVGGAWAFQRSFEELELGATAAHLALEGLGNGLRKVAEERELPDAVAAGLDFLAGEEELEIADVESLLANASSDVARLTRAHTDAFFARAEDSDVPGTGLAVPLARALTSRFLRFWVSAEAEDRLAFIRPIIDELERRDAEQGGSGRVDLSDTAAAIAAVHVDRRLDRLLFWLVFTHELTLIGFLLVAVLAAPVAANLLIRLTSSISVVDRPS